MGISFQPTFEVSTSDVLYFLIWFRQSMSTDDVRFCGNKCRYLATKLKLPYILVFFLCDAYLRGAIEHSLRLANLVFHRNCRRSVGRSISISLVVQGLRGTLYTLTMQCWLAAVSLSRPVHRRLSDPHVIYRHSGIPEKHDPCLVNSRPITDHQP